jgi:integrase
MKRTKSPKKNKNYNWTLTPEDFFSREQRRKLLQTCRERAELDLQKGRKTWVTRYMLVDLALYSGLRVSEIAKLKTQDLYITNVSDPYIIVRNGKGDKTRTVYIDKELQKHLKEYLEFKKKTLDSSPEPQTPLFEGRNGQHPPIITLQLSFKKAVEVAGLPKHFSIHSARHTYATFLLKDTGNLRYVQKQLGHSNIAMTSVYADILPEDNGKLANKIQRD